MKRLIAYICTMTSLLMNFQIVHADFIYGDVSGNNVVTTADAVMVLQYVLDNSTISLSSEALKKADVTGDENIDAQDSANIYNFVINNDFVFPIYETETTTEKLTETTTEKPTETTTEKPTETTTEKPTETTTEKPTETTTENSTETTTQSQVIGFAAYRNVTGGNVEEDNEFYKKVYNAEDLAKALARKSGTKVIEIMNDINLGYNEISYTAKNTNNTPFSDYADGLNLVSSDLIQSGVSKITVQDFDGLTIFSKKPVKLKHAGFTFKRCNNVVLNNIEFDEIWEWDESSKGNYDTNDWDYITIEECSGFWIDHCTFNKAYDGIVDAKAGSNGISITYSKFLGGDVSEGSWYSRQFDNLESNIDSYPMYKYLRTTVGLSKEEIMKISSPQKKTHLIGATSNDAENNAKLEITLANNYYKNSQDRMPRLRGGNAHAFNIVMDCSDVVQYKNIITDEQEKLIKDGGYKFSITSNGAISTESGALLLEGCHIIDVLNPLKNNQSDSADESYTGKIQALNCLYQVNGKDDFYGNSTDENSPLKPEGADVYKEFSWNGFTQLPYEYEVKNVYEIKDTLINETGAK